MPSLDSMLAIQSSVSVVSSDSEENAMRYVDCSQKRAYKTEREAEEVAAHQMSLHREKDLRVYECDQCYSYHLTSKPKHW